MFLGSCSSPGPAFSHSCLGDWESLAGLAMLAGWNFFPCEPVGDAQGQSPPLLGLTEEPPPASLVA